MTPVQKPRTNQPSGYRGRQQPRMFYGTRHQYIYYPIAWLDSISGQTYLPGYYDENGNHYGNVAFKEGDKYKNVICKCEYCDSQVTMDLTSKELQELECPNCGAPMKVLSTLDEMENGGAANSAAGTTGSAYGSYGSSGASVRSSGMKWLILIPVILIAIFMIIGLLSSLAASSAFSHAANYGDNSGYGYSDGYDGYSGAADGSAGYSTDGTGTESAYPAGVSNVDLFGTTIYLDKTADGVYAISADGNASYDKVISWESSYDSYYDPETDCYIWYNNDVAPGIWQYWYEGISSAYEPSGWMEYDESGVWYIEQDYGSWFPLPRNDYTDYLWHIEEQAADAGSNSTSTGTGSDADTGDVIPLN